MLLRLEVDGFKNLLNFGASFGPFTCIAGENGVGKSNIFDAIEFLSLIADRSLLEAAQQVRSSRQDSVGEPEHIFTMGRRDPMRFAVEMIVPRSVDDDFGTPVEPSITLLRYEIEIGYQAPSKTARYGRLVVEREHLVHINRGDAHRHVRFTPISVQEFRNRIVTGRRSGGPFISTEAGSDRITVHGDGGRRGRPRRALPTRAGTSVVSTINTADDPTILAARREMQSWRRLALEPSALRAADRFVDPQALGSDGSHLAAALHRIANEAQGSADDTYARVASRVAGLAGVDIRKLRVDVDDTRQLLSVIVTDGFGRELPARSLSEGTLRYLALCVLLEDPTTTGLIAMEEPENGIHPANLDQVVRLVRDLAVDAEIAPGVDNPLRQVIVNTHSPSVVQLVGAADLLVASLRRVDVDGGAINALRVRGMRDTWRDEGDADSCATKADLLPYLVYPPGAQLGMSFA